MERIQAFELHDLPACPAVIRESVQEALGNGLRWGRIYDGAAPIFQRFCHRAGCEEVLDLGSGSGEPISVLIEACERQGIEPPRFVLSDLYPHAECMARVVRCHPGRVEAVATPVDATRVPAAVDRGARSIITAFHHFAPAAARAILADCVRSRRAVFILEPFVPGLLRAAKVALFCQLAGWLNPLVAAEHRLLKAVLTYLLPVLPLALAWDGLISVLRAYSEQELRALVEPLGRSFAWEYQTVPLPWGGRLTTFSGVPR